MHKIIIILKRVASNAIVAVSLSDNSTQIFFDKTLFIFTYFYLLTRAVSNIAHTTDLPKYPRIFTYSLVVICMQNFHS